MYAAGFYPVMHSVLYIILQVRGQGRVSVHTCLPQSSSGVRVRLPTLRLDATQHLWTQFTTHAHHVTVSTAFALTEVETWLCAPIVWQHTNQTGVMVLSRKHRPLGVR